MVTVEHGGPAEPGDGHSGRPGVWLRGSCATTGSLVRGQGGVVQAYLVHGGGGGGVNVYRLSGEGTGRAAVGRARGGGESGDGTGIHCNIRGKKSKGDDRSPVALLMRFGADCRMRLKIWS